MNLVFLDVETTGLSPAKDKLLEVGMVAVTLPSFEIVAEDHRVMKYDVAASVKAGQYIHPKVMEMHTANGLWASCKISLLDDYRKLDDIVAKFVLDNGGQGGPLAGANPDFDRGFMRDLLPQTLKLFHYRNFDVNAFWLLRNFITGDDTKRSKPASHRAVDDCKDAVAVVADHFEFISGLLGA